MVCAQVYCDLVVFFFFLLGASRLHGVLLGFTEFTMTDVGFTGFVPSSYLIDLVLSLVSLACLGFSGFSSALMRYLRVLLCYTWVSVGLTGFYWVFLDSSGLH